MQIAEGASAREAIEASGVLGRHPQIDPRHLKLAKFGRRIAPDTALQEGDRIEILRPLAMSPMEARRLRARRKARRPER